MHKLGMLTALMSMIFLISCSSQPSSQNQIDTAVAQTLIAQPTVLATETDVATPTETSVPTSTKGPTKTPRPTKTLRPTATFRPTTTPTPVEPITLSGSGDDIVDFEKWNGIAILDIKYSGSRNFIVSSYDSSGEQLDLIVNTIGNYTGRRLIDLRDDHDTTRFEIKSSGDWEISVLPLDEIRLQTIPGVVSGVGDDVILIAGTELPDILDVDASQADSNFIVHVFGNDYELLVNEIAPYTGKVLIDRRLPLDRGNSYALILEVIATGDWKLNVNP